MRQRQPTISYYWQNVHEINQIRSTINWLKLPFETGMDAHKLAWTIQHFHLSAAAKWICQMCHAHPHGQPFPPISKRWIFKHSSTCFSMHTHNERTFVRINRTKQTYTANSEMNRAKETANGILLLLSEIDFKMEFNELFRNFIWYSLFDYTKKKHIRRLLPLPCMALATSALDDIWNVWEISQSHFDKFFDLQFQFQFCYSVENCWSNLK